MTSALYLRMITISPRSSLLRGVVLARSGAVINSYNFTLRGSRELHAVRVRMKDAVVNLGWTFYELIRIDLSYPDDPDAKLRLPEGGMNGCCYGRSSSLSAFASSISITGMPSLIS